MVAVAVTRSSEAPGAASARLVLLAAISRVGTENALEPIQCVHIGFQRSRSHPAVSRYGQTGELSRYMFQAELLKPHKRRHARCLTQVSLQQSSRGSKARSTKLSGVSPLQN